LFGLNLGDEYSLRKEVIAIEDSGDFFGKVIIVSILFVEIAFEEFDEGFSLEGEDFEEDGGAEVVELMEVGGE
jgi:hypothetical protein